MVKMWLPVFVSLALLTFFPCLTGAQENAFQKGLTALQEQRYDDAIKSFSLSIETLPHDYEAYNNRGIAWFYKNEYERAIEDYSMAVKINPEFTEAYNNRGAAWFYLKEFRKAVDDCSRVITLRPDDYEAYNYRGTARYYLEKYQEAINDCVRSLELNPQYAIAYDRLAVILTICPDERFRDPYKAVGLARKAIALNPQAEYLDTLASAYAQTGEFGEAARTQNLAVERLKREGWTTKLPVYTKRLQKYRSLETKMAAQQVSRPVQDQKPIQTPPSPQPKPVSKKAVPEVQASVKAERSYHSGRLPYIVQIGSFPDRRVAAEKALRYHAKGDPTFTSPARIPGKGEWHRVYSGCYADMKSAQRSRVAMEKRNFKAPFVARLPYSVALGSHSSLDALKDINSKLQRLGYIALQLQDDRDPDITWLISGAFKSEKEAQRYARQLAAGGFQATVVRR